MTSRPAIIGVRVRKARGVGRGWMDAARCRDPELRIDPELFFPVGHGAAVDLQIQQAKSECRQCPVTSECLQWAMEDPHLLPGIYGGTTEEERAKMIRHGRVNERKS